MSELIDNERIVAAAFQKIDTRYLTDTLNSATLNDLSNLGLNEEEAEAYVNIMSAREVTKGMDGSGVSFDINYDSAADPGGFLEILTEGQPAPEITGTVHLPAGGTRPTNVLFWEPGQTYEEGAKDPVFFPENDMQLLGTYARPVTEDAINASQSEIAEVVKEGVTNLLSQSLKGE